MATKQKNLPDTGIGIHLNSGKKLVLFNDDVNTFDYVIETLVIMLLRHW